MGKKSRRSNRKGRSSGHGSNLPLPFRRIAKLDKEAGDSYGNKLHSIAAHKYRECIEIIQQFQDAMLRNSCPIDSENLQTMAAFRTNLIMVEYSRCRYDKVIEICNDVQMSAENEIEKSMSFLCTLHGRLAMLRLDASNENKERVVSLIDTRISEGVMDPNEVRKALVAMRVLTSMKEYSAAIILGEKLGRMSEKRNKAIWGNVKSHLELRLTENGERATSENTIADIVTFENAVTHLERYRAVYHMQPDGDFTNDILVRVHDASNIFGYVRKNIRKPRCDAYLMMIAQRDYLCHQVDDKDLSSQLCSNAIKHVEMYLETLCNFERHCFTCRQAGTAREVQLVCSGCHVACYCSLDHQRMTWKKDAIQGMRIGHEILCPLMKAYRKWKLASKKGNERALKLRRRFDRECLYFLSHGLGLKDKCFPEKDVHKYISLQNRCK